MNLRKLIRVVHRDLGYIFFGASIIYGLSGIALNHLHQWNPNYIVEKKEFDSGFSGNAANISFEQVNAFMTQIGENDNYKKHYAPSPNLLKIFISNGNIAINMNTGKASLERVTRRPIFNQFNFLHYNHSKRLWTWFADAFAIALVLFAITGIFMIKGKKGITGRGAWLTAAGIVIPLILYLMYHN